jgi:hypothetical protein
MAVHEPRPCAYVRWSDRGARAFYLKYRGTKNVWAGKSWEAAILEDFVELRKAGLVHTLMDEIKKLFTARG